MPAFSLRDTSVVKDDCQNVIFEERSEFGVSKNRGGR